MLGLLWSPNNIQRPVTEAYGRSADSQSGRPPVQSSRGWFIVRIVGRWRITSFGLGSFIVLGYLAIAHGGFRPIHSLRRVILQPWQGLPSAIESVGSAN